MYYVILRNYVIEAPGSMLPEFIVLKEITELIDIFFFAFMDIHLTIFHVVIWSQRYL